MGINLKGLDETGMIKALYDWDNQHDLIEEKGKYRVVGNTGAWAFLQRIFRCFLFWLPAPKNEDDVVPLCLKFDDKISHIIKKIETEEVFELSEVFNRIISNIQDHAKINSRRGVEGLTRTAFQKLNDRLTVQQETQQALELALEIQQILGEAERLAKDFSLLESQLDQIVTQLNEPEMFEFHWLASRFMETLSTFPFASFKGLWMRNQNLWKQMLGVESETPKKVSAHLCRIQEKMKQYNQVRERLCKALEG